MNVPSLPQERMVDENGMLTKAWQNYFEQQQQNMQQCLSNEGFVPPSQTNANMIIIQNGVDENGNQVALPATLIFDTSAVNGGSGPAPNGQLNILLQDGTFHPITNT